MTPSVSPAPAGPSGPGVYDQPFAPPAGTPYSGAPLYAGFWRRFLAVFIDGIILQVVCFIIVLPLAFMMGITAAGMGNTDPDVLGAMGGTLGFFISVVIQWFYEAGFLSSARQATPGKMALDIVVTDESYGRISFARATGRHFGKYLSGIILLIGFLIQPFTDKKQALHDMLASTLVVRK
jgi:uncharacterized RDD family membrane protein YckC